MPEKLITHAGFIKAISPRLPDSTGREGLYSCRADSGWSSVLASPICCSESRWRGSGLRGCGPNESSWSSMACAVHFGIHRGLGQKESGESAWMVEGTSVSSQEANNSFSSEERVGEVCVSFDIIRSERIWNRTLEWQPRRAQSQAHKTDQCFMAMSKRLGCFWNFSFSRGWFVLLRLITPHREKSARNPPLKAQWDECLPVWQDKPAAPRSRNITSVCYCPRGLINITRRWFAQNNVSEIWSHFCWWVITTSQVGTNRLYCTFHESTTAISL